MEAMRDDGARGTDARGARVSDHAWNCVLSTMVASERYIAQLRAQMGLSSNEMHALLALHVDGSCSISELAGKVSLSRPTMTSLVDRLHDLGWVHRRAHATDRRKVIVATTDHFDATLVERSTTWRHRLRNLASSHADWAGAEGLIGELGAIAHRSAWQLSHGDEVTSRHP